LKSKKNKMIMKAKRLLVLALAVVGFTTAANAQTATATAAVTANIITPISIAKGADMTFGNIVANSSGGTVVIATDGTRSATGLSLPTVAGTVAAAEFTVTGQDGLTYDLTLPTTYDITTGSAGANETMTLSAFLSNATNTLTGGTETFKVGATLTVAANQVSGIYTNAAGFSVSVNYN
jgi:hypothetical protein